jgi:hypothetical protein
MTRTAIAALPVMVVLAALTVVAARPAEAPAAAATPTAYRAVCDPIRWREQLDPQIGARPSACGYWGADGSGPMSDVVLVTRVHWSSWGATARGRGRTVPLYPGRGEKPIAITVTLSRPVVCVHGGVTLRLYTRERVRTRFGSGTFTMRDVPEGYCTEPEPAVTEPTQAPAGTATTP